MSAEIRLSIILSCHVRSHWLVEALESILESGYHFRDTEFLICDDGSPEAAVSAVAEQYAARRPGVIRVLRNQTNQGLVPSFSRLIDACRGEYLMFFDYDDIFVLFDLDGCMDYLDGHPETAAVFGKKRLFTIDGDKGESHGGDYSAFMALTAPCPVTNAMILRLADVREAGAVLPMEGSGWDIYLWIRLGIGRKFVFDDSYRCLYRYHPGQLTRNNSEVYDRNYRFLTDWVIQRYPELWQALNGNGSVTITRDNREACIMLAGRLIQRENLPAEQQLRLFDIALQVMPEDYAVWEYRARLYASLGQYAPALADYFRMLVLFKGCRYVELCALRGVLEVCRNAGIDAAAFEAEYRKTCLEFFHLTPQQAELLERTVADYRRYPEATSW